MPGADAFYPPVVPPPYGAGAPSVSPYGTPPYTTPPPFPSQVFIDGAKAPDYLTAERQQEIRDEIVQRLAAQNGENPAPDVNIDEERIARSTAGAEYAIDPTPLGDITVIVDRFHELTFTAPVKALKGPDGDLIIVSCEVAEGAISEWPVATFRSWQAVYRDNSVK